MVKFRIVIKSNYDNPRHNEVFLNTPPLEARDANTICDILNTVDPKGPNYYTTELPSYKLYEYP